MSRSNANLPYKLSNYKIIRDREIGFGKCIGDDDDLSRKIYSNLDAYNNELYLSRRPLTYNCDQGGIFNLEFSPDGKLLIAACEGKSVLLFDAFNQRFLNKILNAHLKCVNCVRFLDQNTFATCSDDGTIKTWDLRFMKTSTRTLQGHSNWVKNIEYSEKEKVMVTSGFDGSIYSWNLNNNYELGVSYNKVFMMTGLMRTKLTPDDSKMIISTTTGYMIIVHDLNLSTMCADLKNFQPHLYRLMQMTEETFPAATIFNPLFMSSRNRLEFVDDFPNSAEVISSVQIHPMGWSALSRNISTDNETEWTCVHDIQMKEPKEYDDIYKYVEANDQEDTEEAPLEHLTDIWQGIRTLDQSDEYRRSRGRLYQRNYQHWPGEKNRIVKNLPRLTHSIKELSVGKGYIKELCFSSDGRVIGSPYGKGVRLLAFNRDVQEICSCVPKEPQELFVVSKMMDYHSDVVVSCKFNPRHYQMVSGCLGGDIVWYRPIL